VNIRGTPIKCTVTEIDRLSALSPKFETPKFEIAEPDEFSRQLRRKIIPYPSLQSRTQADNLSYMIVPAEADDREAGERVLPCISQIGGMSLVLIWLHLARQDAIEAAPLTNGLHIVFRERCSVTRQSNEEPFAVLLDDKGKEVFSGHPSPISYSKRHVV
jgi:hypothetical protein